VTQHLQPVTVPEGTSGDWSVARFTVSEAEAKFSALRAAIKGEHAVPAGTYTALRYGGRTSGEIVMSDTPGEMRDHLEPVYRARGHVLINGLGLGMVLAAVLRKPAVTQVTVVELSKDVIQLVAPHYVDPRLTIVHADAFKYTPPRGSRYEVVWHDIWPTICSDNLKEMRQLRRKYARRATWQGCWSEDQIGCYR
jgi:hypothetical protein